MAYERNFVYDSTSSLSQVDQYKLYKRLGGPLAGFLTQVLAKFNKTTGAYEGVITTNNVVDTVSVGAQADLAGSGVALTAARNYAAKVCTDDAGANIADSVSGLRSRTLLTVAQSGGSIRALQGQLKILTAKTVANGIYTASQGYVELVGTLGVSSGATFSCFDASMELGGTLTVASGGEAFGIHVETTGAGTITNSGTCAAVGITKASGAASWPVGLWIGTSMVTTGIQIGTCTTGLSITGTTTDAISISGDATNAINITTGCTPTGAGLLIAGAAATPISITGTFTTGISVAADGVTGIIVTDAFSGTTGIEFAGTATDGIKVSGICADGIEISAAATTTGLNISANCVTGITIGAQTTAGITIGATATGISIGSCTTGISVPVGTTTAISVGSKADTAGSGIVIPSTDDWGAVRVFTDDNGANVGKNVRGLQSRTLLTLDQTGGSIRAIQGQTKLLNGIDVTSGIYTAVQGYVEMVGAHISNAGATFSCIDASMEIGTSLTIKSAGEAYGVHVETTGAGSITVESGGACAGIGITKGGSAAWPIGLYVPTGATATPIQIGTWISNTANYGHVLTAITTDTNAGIAVHCDDGGAAITSSITTPIFGRYLLTVDQSSGATQTGLYAQLKSGGDGTRTFTGGGIRGAYIFTQLAATTLASAAELVTINAATSLAGTLTVGTGTKWAGLDINLAGSQTITVEGTGIAAAMMIRAKDTSKWPIGIYFEASAATTAISIAACTTGLNISGATTNAIAISGAPSTAAINISGAEAIGLSINTSTPTDGIQISAACANAIAITGTNTTAGVSISGDQVLGVLFHATAAADAAYRATIPTGITLGAGVDINATSTGIVTSGLTMQGTGTFTTGITLSATAITTGIAISAGSMTDAILISGTTPTDGIHISSACTNAINIGVQTTTGINFAGGGSYNPIHIGTKSNSADAGLILTGVTDDTGGIMVFCDDGGDALGSVTSPIWTRYLLTVAQGSGGPTATGMFAQIKTEGSITCTTGSYTALKAYNQAGTVTLVTSAEYAIINAGVTLEGTMAVGAGCTFSGVDINIGGAGTVSNSGTAAGVIIRSKGEGAVWPVGLYIATGGVTRAISVGTYASLVDTGLPLNGATWNAGFFLDDSGDSQTASTVVRNVISRAYFTVDQDNAACDFDAIRGHIKAASGVDFGGDTSSRSCVRGYLEMAGATICGAGAFLSGIMGELWGDDDITGTGKVAGVMSRLYTAAGTTSGTTAAFMATKHFASTQDWPYGLYIDAATVDIRLTAGPQIRSGAGAPGISATKGSLYLRTDGTSTNDRAYINTDGSTSWAALTTAS